MLLLGNIKMYRVADLKRLKKTELEVIAGSLSLCTSGKKKHDLIQDICTKQSTGQSFNSPLVSHTDTDQNVCIVDFTDPSRHYTIICDEALKSIPAFTFASIYTYFRRDEAESTFKSIDRAVKHTSSGDVSHVALCQVSHVSLVLTSASM
jgi:hypothetical protein